MLDFIKEALDQMATLVGMPIRLPLNEAIAFRWNNRFRIIGGDIVKNRIGIIPSVSHYTRKIEPCKQSKRLWGVTILTRG